MVGGFVRSAKSKSESGIAYTVAQMDVQPAVRASAIRDSLEFLDKFEPGSRERVLAKVPEASRTVIAATSRSAWVGIEHDHHCVDAIVHLFGRARAIDYWSLTISELSDKPLLKSFVSGMLKWMPVEPRRVIAVMATGWPLVYRDMCKIELEVSAQGNPLLQFRELPALVRRHHNYLLSWQGACTGFIKLAGLRASLSFRVAPDLSAAAAEFVLTRV